MSTIKGYVDKIRFRNQDNGYTILQVISEGQSITVVGTFGIIDVGDYIEAKGSNEIHKIYGEQFRVISYTISRPHDIESIKNYLSSGAIKGIGTALASRIVDTFGEDTIRIMEDEPEKLVKIKGISERIAVDIASQVAARSDKRNAMMFLYDYGISMNYASKI